MREVVLDPQQSSQHNYHFCRDKHVYNFVAAKLKNMLVATKDVFCDDKHAFVATKRVCRDKTFVATKMVLVAAPANDTLLPL